MNFIDADFLEKAGVTGAESGESYKDAYVFGIANAEEGSITNLTELQSFVDSKITEVDTQQELLTAVKSITADGFNKAVTGDKEVDNVLDIVKTLVDGNITITIPNVGGGVDDVDNTELEKFISKEGKVNPPKENEAEVKVGVSFLLSKGGQKQSTAITFTVNNDGNVTASQEVVEEEA